MKKIRHGTTAVEFAMVSPVLIAIITGILEFGSYCFFHHINTNAVREVARKASVNTNNPTYGYETLLNQYLGLINIDSNKHNYQVINKEIVKLNLHSDGNSHLNTYFFKVERCAFNPTLIGQKLEVIDNNWKFAQSSQYIKVSAKIPYTFQLFRFLPFSSYYLNAYTTSECVIKSEEL